MAPEELKLLETLRALRRSNEELLAVLKDCRPLFSEVACGEVEDRVSAVIAKAGGK